MNVMSVIKEHPVPIIGGVLLLVILASMRGSSGSAGSNAGMMINAGLESQKIATAANAQIAGINGNVAIARGAQNVAAMSEAGKQAVERTAILGDMWKTSISTSAQVQTENARNATTRFIATKQSEDNQRLAANQLALGQATIDAGVRTSLEKLATDFRMNESNNNTKLSAIGQEIAGQKYAMDVTAAMFGQQMSTNLATVDRNNNTQIALADRTGNTQIALADRANNTSLALAAANNGAQLSAISHMSAASLAALDKNIAANKDAMTITNASLPQLMQHQVTMGQINSGLQQAIAQITGNTAQIISANATYADRKAADTEASNAKTKRNQSWLSSIANVVGAFF